MRILFIPCGEGYGHTIRCIAVASEFLKQGHEVFFAAYGDSKKILKKYDFKVFKTNREIALTGKEGEFDIKQSALESKNILYLITKAALKEYKIIKKINPDIVISDSKYSALLAAKFAGKKSMIIINQNKVLFREKARIFSPIFSLILNKADALANTIIVPDLPKPDALCGPCINKQKNMYFIGPLLRFEAKKYKKKQEYVLSIIGGFGYRSRILKLLNKIAEKRLDLNFKLICGTHKIALKKLKNVEVIAFEKNMQELFAKASLIVSHAGHTTLLEGLAFGKPCIVIPDLNHPEQERNAKQFEKLGCGIALSHKNINEKILEKAIEKILKNKSYRKNAERFAEQAAKKDGRKSIIKIAEKLTASQKH